MYTLKNTTKGVSKFTLDIATKLLFIVTDKELLFENKVILSSEYYLELPVLFNDKLYIRDIRANYWILDFNSFKVIESGKNKFLQKLGMSNLGILTYSDDFISQEVINLNNETVFKASTLAKKNSNNLWVQPFFYSLESWNVLHCITNIDNIETELWKFNARETFQDSSKFDEKHTLTEEEVKEISIKHIIGVYQDQLIIILDGGGFVALDAKTGDLLWTKSVVDINNTDQTFEVQFGEEVVNLGFQNPNDLYFNKEEGKIYILHRIFYIILDLNTRSASYEWGSRDEKSVREEKIIDVRSSYKYGNKIYFIASYYRTAYDDMVGVFDMEQKQIVWQHKFNFDRSNALLQVEANDTHIYVRDMQDNLYTFEKN